MLCCPHNKIFCSLWLEDQIYINWIQSIITLVLLIFPSRTTLRHLLPITFCIRQAVVWHGIITFKNLYINISFQTVSYSDVKSNKNTANVFKSCWKPASIYDKCHCLITVITPRSEFCLFNWQSLCDSRYYVIYQLFQQFVSTTRRAIGQ